MSEAGDPISQALPISHEKKELVAEKVQAVRSTAATQVRTQLESAAENAASQVSSVAAAARATSEQLRSQGQDGSAKAFNQMANRGDQVATYLSTTEPDQVLTDLEDFCRQKPWAVAAGAIVLGFVGGRFLKASSSRRYQERQYPTSRSAPQGGTI